MKVSNESNINESNNYYSRINNMKEDLKSFNKEVLNEINYAREKPEEYIQKLEDIKNSLPSNNEKFLYIDNIPYIYQNLFASLENAIHFLKTQKKLSKLTNLPQLSSSCEELKKDLISNKDYKNNNMKFKERINKHGNTFGDNYEIIGYNLLDPEFIVLNLILSDGDSTNFGRKIIFNPNIKYIGIDVHFSDGNYVDNIHIIIFSEDFCEKTKNNEILINKYKNKNPNYISKTIYYKARNTYIDKEDEIILENKINNIIKSSNKYKVKNKSSKHKNKYKNKNRKNILENNNKIKNDIYFNYYTHRTNFDINNFDEDDFFENEFEKKWGKIEKDKNFQKKIFTTSTTTENGLNTTIISEIFENVQNGVKKGYFKEHKNLKNYNNSWRNENAEEEKRDILAILKEMEKREKERNKNIGKKGKNKNFEYFEGNEELPEGVVDIQVKRKNIIDSDGKPAIEITKTITYEDGSVQNIVRRQVVDNDTI